MTAGAPASRHHDDPTTPPVRPARPPGQPAALCAANAHPVASHVAPVRLPARARAPGAARDPAGTPLDSPPRAASDGPLGAARDAARHLAPSAPPLRPGSLDHAFQVDAAQLPRADAPELTDARNGAQQDHLPPARCDGTPPNHRRGENPRAERLFAELHAAH